MPENTLPWQTIGWDGISFELPAAWQPTLILKFYLFFEQQGKPAFAVKWQHIQGHFFPERILNKLHKSLKPTGSNVSEWIIDDHLRELLPSFSMTGFQWQESRETGRGILLFCPDCRKATLMQVYGPEQKARETFKKILASFADHKSTEGHLWSIYDIQATLPAEARLSKHEFMVGRYTLTFEYQKTAITLYRFKPAAALLAGQTLTDFGQPLADSAPRVLCGENSVSWSSTTGGIGRIITLLQRKPAWIWLQLWHIPEKNVILGVKGAGRRPLDESILTAITAHFTAK